MFVNSKKDGGGTKQSSSHSHAIVSQVKREVMNATKDFKDILEIRQENMKIQQNRRSRYGQTAARYMIFDIFVYVNTFFFVDEAYIMILKNVKFVVHWENRSCINMQQEELCHKQRIVYCLVQMEYMWKNKIQVK